MGEITAAITGWHCLHPDLFPRQRLALKFRHAVQRFALFAGVPVHIQQRRRQQFGHVVAFIELRRPEQAVTQRLWHRFAMLIVARIAGKYFGVACPVLINLGRELHEVTGRVGAGQRGKTLVGKQPMQRMAKLMEQRNDIIP